MSKIDCSNVYVSESSISDNMLGAFAKFDFKEGDLIERGLVKRLDKSFDGMNNPHVFTWSDNIPNKTWAFGSGCATFYNTSKTPNTKMIRHFDEDKFEIYACKDINKGEELTHKYKSLQWRTCFSELSNNL